MKILITGAQGFIGHHLVRALQDEHEIYALSRQIPHAFAPKVHWLQQDLTQPLEEERLPASLDAIVHLAQSEYFRDFPARAPHIFHVNTVSTVHLLDYARRAGVRTFVLASSGGIYGYGDQEFSEDVAVSSQDDLGFYLGTKLCAEVLAASYRPLMNVIILRFFFVYGPSQRNSMLIPRLVRAVQTGMPITLQGEDGIKINPTYIADAITAITRALPLAESHKINIGGPEVLSLRDIGITIGRMVGREPTFEMQPDAQPRHLVGDIRKMTRLLSAPGVRFEDGLRRMLAPEER